MRDDEDREVIAGPIDDTTRFNDADPLVSRTSTPLLQAKDYTAQSVFRPENLLREARRQKGLPIENVPKICILDPDGDILRQLQAEGRTQRFPAWACYHTDLFIFELGPEHVGIIGCAVGASFAVLIAEQLFASGCSLLISISSSDQIAERVNDFETGFCLV